MSTFSTVATNAANHQTALADSTGKQLSKAIRHPAQHPAISNAFSQFATVQAVPAR
jgi:hypothetical protein